MVLLAVQTFLKRRSAECNYMLLIVQVEQCSAEAFQRFLYHRFQHLFFCGGVFLYSVFKTECTVDFIQLQLCVFVRLCRRGNIYRGRNVVIAFELRY